MAFIGGPGRHFEGKETYGGYDSFLTKYSSNGSRVWTQILGSTNGDWTYDVCTSQDGSIYLTGYTGAKNLDNQKSNGNYDAFIAKYGSDGRKEWTRIIGGQGSDYSYAISSAKDGSVYIAGEAGGPYFDGQAVSGNGSDVFLTKYSSNGNKQWTRVIGGLGWHRLKDITTTNNGSIYITGFTSGDTFDGNQNKGKDVPFVSKFKSNGA